MKYGYTKQVTLPFAEAVAKTKDALAAEGFGVLTEIDVKATLKQKLDVDREQYVILGACDPASAHKALEAEKEIGLLLPCNVIVYEDEGAVYVSAILPTVAMQVAESDELETVATEVETKLKTAVDAIE